MQKVISVTVTNYAVSRLAVASTPPDIAWTLMSL